LFNIHLFILIFHGTCIFIKDVDLALGRLLHIGILVAFKTLIGECLNDLLDKRLPFLMFSAQDMTKTNQNTKFDLVKKTKFPS
jgi:hypothetical protein